MNKSKLLHALDYTKSHIRVRLPTVTKSDVFTVYIHNDLYDRSMDSITIVDLFNSPFYQTDAESIKEI